MRTPLLLALLAALALSLTPDRAQAQGLALMPYAGYNTEEGFGFLVGIGAEFVAPSLGGLALTLQPGVEYVSTDIDGLSYLQVDVNAIARFGAPGASIAPFAGAGLGIGFSSSDVTDDTDTDLGLNLLGGIAFPGVLAFGEPYAQARYSFIGGDALSIMGGLRIPLGR